MHADSTHVVEDGDAGAGSPFQEALAFQNRSPSQNILATLSMRLNTQCKSLTRYVLATHFFVLVAFSSFLDTRWDYFDKESSQRPFKVVQRQKPPQFCTILIFCTHARSVWLRIALGDHCPEDYVTTEVLAVKKLSSMERGRNISQTVDFPALCLTGSICLVTWKCFFTHTRFMTTEEGILVGLAKLYSLFPM